jgi:hypothetical protein
MRVCSEVTDYVWLTSNEAGEILADLAASEAPLHTAVARLRRSLSAERTHLVLELVELRRRAADKFAAADRMFFTRRALEQATDEWIARYKASRFAGQPAAASSLAQSPQGGPPHVADLCCGIGGDLMALANSGSVIGVDSDPMATHFAEANIAAVCPSAEVRFQTADAARFALDEIDAWHIDPDRRPGDRRTTSLDACRPDGAALDRLLQRVPNAGIKLAPANQTPSSWAGQCELEWISRGGECRQLVAWHGKFAEHPGQHRATILSGPDTVPRTFAGTANREVPIAAQLHERVYDFDRAVHAAGLQGELAAANNLRALSAGPTYYTGSVTIIDDPALTCFQVNDVLPLRLQQLARYLHERCIGQLEIKKRGVDIVPEQLRSELKLRGDNMASLLITKIGGRPKVIVAQRIV